MSLPERHYVLAGQILAEAIEGAVGHGGSILAAVARAAAAARGRIGAQSRAAAQSQADEASGSTALCPWPRYWRPAATNHGPRVTG